MKLIPVALRADHLRHLYRAIQERPKEACISHREMPSLASHKRHVVSHLPGAASTYREPNPDAHRGWYLIEDEGVIVGVIYLSARDEIGIDIFEPYRARGIAPIAIDILKLRHPRPRYYANVAPGNVASRKLFERMGFGLIQYTFVSGAA